MRQSQLFTKTIKEVPKDETSFNAQALIRAGFINKLSAGIYTFLPLGLRVHNKIIGIIREEMDALGAQEILMPALTPKSIWEQTGRWENFDALYKLEGAEGREYALGATHEEVVTPLLAGYALSYKDLPKAVYQIQTKFRKELRAKAGLLRGREFSMKDLYSFHRDEKDLDEYYEKVKNVYFRIFDRLGIKTILTYASGGAFSKYSHEFQTEIESGEDTIHVCPMCGVAVNAEIIAEQGVCPQCNNEKLEARKAIEVGNIFKLMNKFSSAFGYKFTDEDGTNKDVQMGCYGIGPSRIMGTIVEIHHDERGIIWPAEVAPFRVHLISLNKNSESENIYNELTSAGIEVLFDDRELQAGEKFAESDMIGCPVRLVVSAKTLAKGGVELKRRNSEEIEVLNMEKIKEIFNS